MLDKLNETTGREDIVQSLEGAIQREVSLAVDTKDHEDLSILIEESGSIRDEARLGSLGLPSAGSWLNVIPSPALALNLQAAEFVVAAKYRLGVPVYFREGRCMACPVMSGIESDHAISCGWRDERFRRHNALRDVLFITCQQAALAPVREYRALLPGTEKRTAYISCPTGQKAGTLLLISLSSIPSTWLMLTSQIPTQAMRLERPTRGRWASMGAISGGRLIIVMIFRSLMCFHVLKL